MHTPFMMSVDTQARDVLNPGTMIQMATIAPYTSRFFSVSYRYNTPASIMQAHMVRHKMVTGHFGIKTLLDTKNVVRDTATRVP